MFTLKKIFTLLIIIPCAFFLASCDKIKNSKDLTPLMRAVLYQHPKQIDSLLVKGANPNAMTPNGNTALILAASVNDLYAIKALLQYGAKINAQNHVGVTPLIAASSSGYKEAIVLLLQSGADICLRAANHLDAAQTAEAWGNHETAMFLQNYQNKHAIRC